ncbi:hypothetical protein BKA93DRAFT_827925 [Sparassis latifolia]
MDLTFGFSSARANVWILMAIDHNKKGVPVAYAVFSVKEETLSRGVHADYNTELLQSLLGHWIDGMGVNASGEKFAPLIGSSDNDTREHTAMTTHWPNIFLILCLYHTWQSWQLGLNHCLAGVPNGEHCQEVRSQLARLCMQLIKNIVDYDTTKAAYQEELAYFVSLGHHQSEMDKKKSVGGLKLLNYLSSYLVTQEYWLQWSHAGAIKAAEILGVRPEDVPRMTNHLESHNNHLKGDYFQDHKHGGWLSCIDVWIFILIMQVIPDFFAHCNNMDQLRNHYDYLRTAPKAHLAYPAPTVLSESVAGESLTEYEADLLHTMLTDDSGTNDTTQTEPETEMALCSGNSDWSLAVTMASTTRHSPSLMSEDAQGLETCGSHEL